MNRTRSDSRYLELESSTHCNGHEARPRGASPYALKLIHHAQQKVPLSFCLPSPLPASPLPSQCSPFLSSDRYSYYSYHLLEFRVRSAPKVNRLHSRIVEYLWTPSGIFNRCIFIIDIDYSLNIRDHRTDIVLIRKRNWFQRNYQATFASSK